MKKLFKLLIFLFAMYLAAQFIFGFFSKGYSIEYNIADFNIKETKTQNIDNEQDNYYFEITIGDTKFNLQTYQNLSNSERVIKKIEYFKDNNYECILPVIKNNINFSDIICLSGGDYYYYHDIKGVDYLLDSFVDNIENYDVNNYIDKEEIKKSEKDITVYNNYNSDLYVGLEYYKGVYFLNNRNGIYQRNIFNKDTYTKDISVFIKDKYIVADYNEEYDFHKFYVVDMRTYQVEEIVSNSKVSIYSYVQGIVGDDVYIIDTSNKKQYEIDIKTMTIIEVGNETTGIKIYQNNEWVQGNIYDAINNRIYFNNLSVGTNFNGTNYVRVDKVGSDKSGYYYLYQYNNGAYNVYRVPCQNTENKTFIFRTSNINNVIYKDNYIFYKDDVYIKFYNDLTGVRKLVKNKEISFNDSLKFGIYIN